MKRARWAEGQTSGFRFVERIFGQAGLASLRCAGELSTDTPRSRGMRLNQWLVMAICGSIQDVGHLRASVILPGLARIVREWRRDQCLYL